MLCPNCRFESPGSDPACPACGLIFARYRARQEAAAAAAAVEPVPAAAGTPLPDVFPEGVDPQAWAAARAAAGAAVVHGSAGQAAAPPDTGRRAPGRLSAGQRALLYGVPAGLLLLAIGPLRVLVQYLSVLVHELGHTVVAWVFGYPAIPAFDFVYGGGVTIHEGRNTGLLIVIGAAFLWLCWLARRQREAVGALVAVALVYVLLLATSGHEVVQIAAGHVSELVFATVFLYRAVDGRACHHEIERPLYAALGTFLAANVALFGVRLIWSAEFRAEYADAKGGGGWMDLTRLAQEFLDTSVERLAALLVVGALAVPLAAWASVAIRRRVDGAAAHSAP